MAFPSARSEGLLVGEVGDETVVYDLRTKDAHCLKPLAAFVFAQADGATSVPALAAAATEQLGAPVSEREVRDAIAQLDGRALLATPLVVHDGLSRRDIMRRAGQVAGGAAFVTPLITSIVAPTAAMAASAIASGCGGCASNFQCASNHCCQSLAKDCLQGCCVDHDNSCHVCTINGITTCTVKASDIPGGCPCICGTPGCVSPCCPNQALTCCVANPPC